MYLGFRSFLVLSINVKEWKKWEEIIMERKDAWYIRESTKKQVLEGFNFDMQLKKYNNSLKFMIIRMSMKCTEKVVIPQKLRTGLNSID